MARNFRQRNHFIILHALGKFGKGMFELSQQQHGYYHHNIKPGRLRSYNGSHTISNQGNNNSRNAKDMELGLFHVIV